MSAFLFIVALHCWHIKVISDRSTKALWVEAATAHACSTRTPCRDAHTMLMPQDGLDQPLDNNTYQ